MIVLIRAMNTSRWKPPSKAAAKMKNFEKKPANGGMPARENKAKVNRESELWIGIVQPVVVVEREFMGTQGYNRDDCKYAEVGKHVNQYIKDQ